MPSVGCEVVAAGLPANQTWIEPRVDVPLCPPISLHAGHLRDQEFPPGWVAHGEHDVDGGLLCEHIRKMQRHEQAEVYDDRDVVVRPRPVVDVELKLQINCVRRGFVGAVQRQHERGLQLDATEGKVPLVVRVITDTGTGSFDMDLSVVLIDGAGHVSECESLKLTFSYGN